VGISSIVHDGDLLMTIVWIVINISISGVLFNGAKTKDTTHCLVWLVFSVLEIVVLIIGMCYFAYQAEQYHIIYNYQKQRGSLNIEQMENIWNSRIVYTVYSVIFSVLSIFLFTISIIVKKFYDELHRRSEYQPHHGR
jgi:NADH:ubiquinone oxidoreductase subunit 5 (subunit L)/multisubunit Na+/H+ antiporter MnhA subunit